MDATSAPPLIPPHPPLKDYDAPINLLTVILIAGAIAGAISLIIAVTIRWRQRTHKPLTITPEARLAAMQQIDHTKPSDLHQQLKALLKAFLPGHPTALSETEILLWLREHQNHLSDELCQRLVTHFETTTSMIYKSSPPQLQEARAHKSAALRLGQQIIEHFRSQSHLTQAKSKPSHPGDL